MDSIYSLKPCHCVLPASRVARLGKTTLLIIIGLGIGVLLSFTEIYATSKMFLPGKTLPSQAKPEWKLITKGEKRAPQLMKTDMDPKHLLNMTDFQFLSNYWAHCSFNFKLDNNEGKPEVTADKIFLIIVRTVRDNMKERQIIRQTWGSIQSNPGWSVRTIFLMGLDPSKFPFTSFEDDSDLDEEISEFGDLIVANFIDTPKNESYKALSTFKWVQEFCSIANFVMFVDDDVFLDVNRLTEFRNTDILMGADEAPNFYCAINSQIEPVRDPDAGYYVSADEFQDSFYPEYCSGFAYGMTTDIMQKLYSVSSAVRFLWISDVYATGILMEEAQAKYFEEMDVITRDLWKEGDVTLDEVEYSPLCDSETPNKVERKFKTIVRVPSGDDFEKIMTCLANKVKSEHEIRKANGNEF